MHPTNWYVFTGAPCSGKTTAIQEMNRLGYTVVQEVARAFIEAEVEKGKCLSQIKADKLAFERHILNRKIEIESSLPEKEIIFFDRAIPDSIAYYKIEGLDPSEPIALSKKFRYKKIFLFERLRFERDEARSESDLTAASLESLLYECYRMLEYSVVRVPLLSASERTDFILQQI
jgi:predicted ATPase